MKDIKLWDLLLAINNWRRQGQHDEHVYAYYVHMMLMGRIHYD